MSATKNDECRLFLVDVKERKSALESRLKITFQPVSCKKRRAMSQSLNLEVLVLGSKKDTEEGETLSVVNGQTWIDLTFGNQEQETNSLAL